MAPYDVSTCPGPDGEPIPLVHYENKGGPGMLAVSYTDIEAVFTTPSWPLDTDVNPVMLSAEDRCDLAERLETTPRKGSRSKSRTSSTSAPSCGNESRDWNAR